MPYISLWWSNLLEIEYTFDLTRVLEPIKISEIIVNQGLRYRVTDVTFEVQKEQPQLKIRALIIVHMLMFVRSPSRSLFSLCYTFCAHVDAGES